MNNLMIITLELCCWTFFFTIGPLFLSELTLAMRMATINDFIYNTHLTNAHNQDRAYGCPSIRSDLPAGARSRRSLADSQNYGDDVPARDLVNPPAFSDMAIAPTAMSEPRSKDKLVQLFAKIGHPLDREISDALFAEASGGSSVASINNFRAALNEYLDAIETDRIRQWRRERGL